MNYKINLLPDAYSDIKEIIDWYNRAERGLGKKFYESLKSKFKKISINPLHYQLSFNPKYALAILLRPVIASKSVIALLFSTSP